MSHLAAEFNPPPFQDRRRSADGKNVADSLTTLFPRKNVHLFIFE